MNRTQTQTAPRPWRGPPPIRVRALADLESARVDLEEASRELAAIADPPPSPVVRLHVERES